MPSITLVGKITQDYLRKFPNTSKRELAKLLFQSEPKVFSSCESARNSINRHTGVSGLKNTSTNVINFINELKKLKKELPKGETDRIETYHLPKDKRKVLMLSDIHFPYQDDAALFASLEFGEKNGVDTIWLNGDIMDMYQLSRFEKDPRKRNFIYELDCVRVFLKGIRAMFPKALIIYKMGNHENRWEAFLKQKAPELLGMEEFELSTLLHFNEHKIILLKDKQLAYCGELPVLHFHELPLKSGGVNPARTVFLKTGHSVIGGHYHRKSEHVERTLENKLIKVYSTGCLCDLYAAYMPFNNWSHGAALIEVDKLGKYKVNNFTIIDGKIY
ncbi:MAG: metallophosphoesterase [Chitinophagia bacterium]